MLVKPLTALALALLVAAPASAIPLDPRSFDSIGALRGSTGTLTINTDGDVPYLQFNLEGFKGVVVPQGNGLPDIAVFAFDGIAVTGSVSIRGSGSQIDHLVRIASGSGFTAIGPTEARAAVVLSGGTYSALGGLLSTSRLEGYGAVIGPVEGTAGSALLASGGTLTLGDANRSDGVTGPTAWIGGAP
jgi:hypothetical protein